MIHRNGPRPGLQGSPSPWKASSLPYTRPPDDWTTTAMLGQDLGRVSPCIPSRLSPSSSRSSTKSRPHFIVKNRVGFDEASRPHSPVRTDRRAAQLGWKRPTLPPFYALRRRGLRAHLVEEFLPARFALRPGFFAIRPGLLPDLRRPAPPAGVCLDERLGPMDHAVQLDGNCLFLLAARTEGWWLLASGALRAGREFQFPMDHGERAYASGQHHHVDRRRHRLAWLGNAPSQPDQRLRYRHRGHGRAAGADQNQRRRILGTQCCLLAGAQHARRTKAAT